MSGSRTAIECVSGVENLITCSLCFEKFNMLERLPKVIDCGHTFCLDCLTKSAKRWGRVCPSCRQTFTEAPFALKTNFHLCQEIDKPYGPRDDGIDSTPSPSAVSMRFFCTRCDKDATDTCLMMNHQVCDKAGLNLRRIQDAKLQAQRHFEREGVILKDTLEMLNKINAAITKKGGLASRLQRELSETKKQIEVVDKTQRLIDKVPASTFQDNDDVPRALWSFLLHNSSRLFALEEQKRMLETAKKCTVTVCSEEAGLAWSCRINASSDHCPPEESVLSYLVYLMLLSQQHRMTDSAATQTLDSPGSAPSAPFLEGTAEGDLERVKWSAGQVTTASLEDLIGHFKQCVVDGIGPGEKSDDSDDDSDTSSVVSEVSSTLPPSCQNSKKVFVGRIPPSTSPEEIKEVLSKFGRILYVRFLYSKSKMSSNTRKSNCAFAYVPDTATVENILRNRPIVYQKKGQFGRCLLNVKEDETQRRESKKEAKRQWRSHSNKKGGQKMPTLSNSQNSAEDSVDLRRVFVNQVPLDATEDSLVNFFSRFGAVESVSKRRHGVGNKCMAFVTFKTVDSAKHILGLKKSVRYYGESCPGGLDMQIREFRSNAAPSQPTASSSPQNQSKSGSTFNSAATVAMSASCEPTTEKRNNECTGKSPLVLTGPQANLQNSQHLPIRAQNLQCQPQQPKPPQQPQYPQHPKPPQQPQYPQHPKPPQQPQYPQQPRQSLPLPNPAQNVRVLRPQPGEQAQMQQQQQQQRREIPKSKNSQEKECSVM